MRLRSDEDTDTLGYGGVELFIQLVDTHPVAEVEDSLLVLPGNIRVFPALVVNFAAEDNADVEADEDVVVRGAGLDRNLEGDVLLGDEELDLGPRETPDEATLVHDRVESPELGDDCVRTLGHVDIRGAGAAFWDQCDRRITRPGVVAEPLEAIVDIADTHCRQLGGAFEIMLVVFAVRNVVTHLN